MKKFTTIALSSAFAFATYVAFDQDLLDLNELLTYEEQEIMEQGYESSRQLTPGETKLALSLFGAKIDTSNIQLNFYEQYHDELSSNVTGYSQDQINIYGSKNYSDDYSQADDHIVYGVLTYGMTRVWQNQNNVTFNADVSLDQTYKLANFIDFDEYGPHQQAAVVMDYSTRILHDNHEAIVMREEYGENRCDGDNFLMRVAEKGIPSLKEARESLELTYQRRMTNNEIELAELIFADQIDAGKIVQHMNPINCVKKGAHVDSWYDITYFGLRQHEDDYTLSDEQYNLGVYVHELTHIWQNQTRRRYTNEKFVNEPDAYLYPIENDKYIFANYAVEQQAAILEDYARQFLYKEGATRRDVNIEGLKLLVERHFPHLETAREYFEEHQELPINKPKPRPANNNNGIIKFVGS